jgi:hypothetical protein
MSALHDSLAEYLAVRRALGYRLEGTERLLGQFLDDLDATGAGRITVEHALTWAILPGCRQHWHADAAGARRYRRAGSPETGLRASELTGLHCSDIHLGTGAHATTTGKGRKQRITPLTKETATVLRVWLAERGRPPAAPLFPTSTGKPLTRKAVARRIGKARYPRRPAQPVAHGEDDHAACAAPHGRDAAVARWGRHHGDRAVARAPNKSKPHRCTSTPTSRSRNERWPGRSRWTAKRAATARQSRSSDSRRAVTDRRGPRFSLRRGAGRSSPEAFGPAFAVRRARASRVNRLPPTWRPRRASV